MKMYDKGKILTGLAIFLAIVTFPLWYNATSGKGSYVPEPELPPAEKLCVESKEYMKASHMDLLNEWRTQVVREGKREYVSTDGRKFDMSLSLTCMKCHSNREKFCTQCHDYTGVTPYCWDCHVEPEEPE